MVWEHVQAASDVDPSDPGCRTVGTAAGHGRRLEEEWLVGKLGRCWLELRSGRAVQSRD